MDRKIQEAFGQVRAEKELKEHTKQSLYAQCQTRNTGNISNIRSRSRWTGALRYGTAAVLLTVFIVLGIFNRPVDAQASYIRLEGDVSVGLSLDERDMVIAVQGLNEQGEQLLKDLKLEGMSYREAVDCIMESKLRLTGEKPAASTSVTVEGEDEEKCHRLQTEVTKQCSSHEKKHNSGHESSVTDKNPHSATPEPPSSTTHDTKGNGHKNNFHHSQKGNHH